VDATGSGNRHPGVINRAPPENLIGEWKEKIFRIQIGSRKVSIP
jgi:hypothetical protein